ncbi:MAG: RagB/SusD family nutrient uptake outer membrane protein, partial [Cytophagales bacterium]|nr:RagB/SusD family nutrient uptake outer membrane protein [Cytophagales bacterium]
MKRIMKPLIAIVVFITISYGCQEDLLDKQPLDKISSADVWGSKSLIDGYMAYTYSRILPMYTFTDYSVDDWSDDLQSGFHLWPTQEAFDDSRDFGWNQYWRIRLCNTAIEELNVTTVLDESDKNEALGEARMLRSMVYFWMVRYFGGVMKVDRVLDPTEDMKLARATEAEMIDFMAEDLRFAKDNLPTSSDIGRLNKAAAHAFLIRVLLHGGRYDDVIAEAKDFIDVKGNYGYSIDPDFNGIHNNFQGIHSSENILVRHGDENGLKMTDTPMQYRLPLANGEDDKVGTINDYTPSFYGWSDTYPTQDLVDAFLMVDDDGVAKKWNET